MPNTPSTAAASDAKKTPAEVVGAEIALETSTAESRIGATGSNYGADQIQVLEGLDAVRKRPGMYIGGTGLNALHHLVYEVVDNSIDEAMAGHATIVDVTIQADGSCAVVDDGRGIPTGPMKHEDPTLNGRPAIEIVLTKLHAGGKFQQEGSAYKVSGGLHGVGVSCVNALSTYLTAEVYRDGEIHAITFERGRVSEPLKRVGAIPANAARKRGTTVTFQPDPTIFPETRFDYNILANRLRELAFLNPGVALRLTDERVGPDGKIKSELFKADKGLPEYVEHLMTGKTGVSDVVYFKKEDAQQSLIAEVAFQYNDGYNESLLSFANNINNVDGGTHAQGFKSALTRTINGYAKKAGIIKDKDPVPSGEDLREGLVCIVSVKLPNPTFNNQPKEKLLNPEIEGFVSGVVNEGLDRWLEEHPAEAKKLCLKGIIAAQAREAARKARELTRRKSALDSGSMPHKLADCKSKQVENCEIFIVEGDSAGGSAKQGRDVEFQAILPLKGKVLNVEKARIDQVLKFEEIRTLIAALRVGIGSEFDISKLRYGKIIIMTDADVDGSHIRTLLLTFFFRQMPELIRRGHLFVAQPPLYQVMKSGSRTKKGGTYVLNESKLDDALTELGLAHCSLVVRNVTRKDEANFDVKEVRRLEGHPLKRAIVALRRIMELVDIAQRRGIVFKELLAKRSNDPTGRNHLPTHRLTWRSPGGAQGEDYAWSEADAMANITRRKLQLADRVDAQTLATPQEAPANGVQLLGTAIVRELHENKELDKLFAELESHGIPVNATTFSDEQAETVTGQKVAAPFAWVAGQELTEPQPEQPDSDEPQPEEKEKSVKRAGPGKVVEAANLPEIIAALRDIGRRGLDVKRFKGLGEMDAEQLWETTMDNSKRTLLKVTLESASQADTLFSILMGEEVEPRRKFIEEHALEVRNLDV
jgi:DNA gyrase subunit B